MKLIIKLFQHGSPLQTCCTRTDELNLKKYITAKPSCSESVFNGYPQEGATNAGGVVLAYRSQRPVSITHINSSKPTVLFIHTI